MSPEALERLERALAFAREHAQMPVVMGADLRALLDAHETARAEGVAALRARVAEFEEVRREEVEAWNNDRLRAEKAERERDELREHTLSLERQVGDLRKMYEKAEAQVAAARAMCLRFNANPESAMPSPVSMVLRAMDGAAK